MGVGACVKGVCIMEEKIIKCACGAELKRHAIRYVIEPIKQEFVCYKCWVAAKEKSLAEVENCGRCGKLLEGKDFIDHRYCYAPDKDGKIGWNRFCIECEPYTEMAKHH